MSNEEISRREFVKRSAVSAVAMAAASSAALAAAPSATDSVQDTAHAVTAALGDLFVPSKPGDPGYKDLEPYGITEYVLKHLKIGRAGGSGEGVAGASGGSLADLFNAAAKEFFGGKTFLQLDGKEREEYLQLIVDGNKIADEKLRTQLQTFYRASRVNILSSYYKNFPEHEVKRNDKGEPILKPGDRRALPALGDAGHVLAIAPIGRNIGIDRNKHD